MVSATLKFILLFYSLFVIIGVNAQTNKQRPSIGVALSGGGAKGLAHIGILKAMDSAGLKVSYVTGTSMGSIVAALYASGYSANEIEKIARSIDWDLLLSNSSTLRSLIMEEKDEYARYAVELPWVNHGFRLPSGVLESEELWLKFSELFFPVYKSKDFSKLSKGFECIATDVSTGEMVTLNKGELTYAVRSSMAIPSVFTAVDYQGKKLVDGGLVRNFPVTNAKEMGANYVIGSSVTSDLLTKEKINNIFDVMLQIVFFREDADTKKEKAQCDVYVQHSLSNYTMGSFSSSNEIIDAGIKKGNELFPRLKQVADSLNAIYGVEKYNKHTLPKVDSVKITEYEINGLNQTFPDFFLRRMKFENNKWYTPTSLSNHIRNAFGTRYYNKIVYSLQPLPDSTVRVVFDVDENPLTFAKLSINYNTFSGVSLIGNLTSRNFFTPYSRSMVILNIGESLRLRAQHLQFFGKSKTIALAATIQAEQLNINTYNNFLKSGAYKQGYFTADLATRISLKRKNSFGIGLRFETFNYKPQIASQLEIHGFNNLLTGYFSYKLNTLSNSIYPRKGIKLEASVGYVFNQHSDLQFSTYNQPLFNYQDSTKLSFQNFTATKIQMENYIPIANKYTLQTKLQAGINFSQRDNLLNSYFVGGLTNTFRNQITFAGLQEGTITSGSVGSAELGLRYQMYSNLFIIGKMNTLIYDFIASDRRATKTSFLTGYALTLGYNFVLGPLEVSAMYCDQSKKILPYINLGIPF